MAAAVDVALSLALLAAFVSAALAYGTEAAEDPEATTRG
jgi:hypothetical protein